MAISVADNFSYLGTKPLDARISFDTVSAMASASEATLYDGCFAYVKATQKYYSYDSTNTSDPTTGKWREYSSGGGGGTSDYTSLTNKPSINGVELLGNKVIGLLSTNIQVNADKIGYNNTTSGMLATNVKNALDELKSSIVDSYTNLSNKPSINGEELLGNKTIGLLSGNIQVDSDKIGYNNTESGLTATNVKAALDELANGSGGTSNYPDLTNKPSINGVELLGNKTVGLLSGNIQIGSDAISYNNTASGLSATTVKGAIDEVLTKETTVTTDSSGYVITDPKNTHVTIPPASLSGTAGMAAKSGTQGTVYTITDYGSQITADVYTKTAVDDKVTASTTDITAGTTPLTTGNLYLVYE